MKVESVIAWGGWLTGCSRSPCASASPRCSASDTARRANGSAARSCLIARENEESADLLVTAVTRDMRGAHSRVLANRDWGELSLESLTDTSDQVATAFARYPYPESFFSWRQRQPAAVSCSSIARTGSRRGCRSPPQPTGIRWRSSRIRPEADALREKVVGVQRRALPLCDVRHDAWRAAVSDRGAARYADPLQERCTR